jgi:hypothetical protein
MKTVTPWPVSGFWSTDTAFVWKKNARLCKHSPTRKADNPGRGLAGNKRLYERVYYPARKQFRSVGFYMPITPYLDDFNVDPKTKRVLSDALELTRVSLGLGDDLANGIIAKQIVELAKTGERNPDRLCEGALKKLREHLFGD